MLTIREGGGDDLLVVKENQPTLDAAFAAAFAPEDDDTGRAGTACTVGQHGNRAECRRLTAFTAPAGDSDRPGLRQALQIERRGIDKRTGVVLRQETAYAVTALPPAARDPRTCWRCGAATGRWRTSGTPSATWPSTRTGPPSGLATPPGAGRPPQRRSRGDPSPRHDQEHRHLPPVHGPAARRPPRPRCPN